jgi:hypothetical protein
VNVDDSVTVFATVTSCPAASITRMVPVVSASRTSVTGDAPHHHARIRRDSFGRRSKGATMGYVILENEDTLRLTAEVMQRMTKGWKPLGGVACCWNSTNGVIRYAQAMVLEPPSPADRGAARGS